MANVEGMKVIPPHNRYQGRMPKIGIRPIIDGRRRGVRGVVRRTNYEHG